MEYILTIIERVVDFNVDSSHTMQMKKMLTLVLTQLFSIPLSMFNAD